MRDVIQGIVLIAATYIGSAGFAVLLFKMFFPLKAKKEEVGKLTLTYSKNKLPHTSALNSVHLLSVTGRRDWVKSNS